MFGYAQGEVTALDGQAERLIPCALFDFDDTLCKGDSILPYLIFAVRKGYAPWTQLPKAGLAFLSQRLDPGKTVRAKETALSFIRGRTQREMDDLARAFFCEEQYRKVFADALAELERHRSAGRRVIVISASADVYMRVLPEFLPVDAVLSTRCRVDAQGRYTGEIEGNCKGDEKPQRLKAYLRMEHAALDAAVSFAYGDSPGDAPMLRLTAHPVAVNAGRRLKALVPSAAQAAWQRTMGGEARARGTKD